MAVGVSAAYAAEVLNLRRASNLTAWTAHLKLHTGDPGASATANASAETTRKPVTFSAPSAGSMVGTAVSWTSWPAGTEIISHISEFDALTAGNFKQSGALGSSKTVSAGDTLTITPTMTQGSLAA